MPINRTSQGSAGFFSLPRTLNTATLVATLVASSAGVWILFSPVETVSWAGVSGLLGYALGQALPLLFIACIGLRLLKVLPAGQSLPQWADWRYGGMMRIICLAISSCYLAVFLAAELTALGKVGELLIPTMPAWLIVGLVTFLTWTYTNRGGLRLVVITDIVQLGIFIPLGLVVFFSILAATSTPNLERLSAAEPQLLSLSYRPGLEFAATLIIAIVAAQIFNQALWQRAYAARDTSTLRTGFIIAGLLMIPLVLASGYLGLIAVDAAVATASPEIGIFALLLAQGNSLLLAGLGIMAMLLVMSSADSILNALSGLVSEELARHRSRRGTADRNSQQPRRTDLRQGRLITSCFAVSAAVIAAQGWSVLYLFLLADLICAAAVVPLFSGLYNSRLSQTGAVCSIGLGLLGGALFMLRPDLSTPLIANPIGSSWLLSFSTALGLSSLGVVLQVLLAPRKE